MWCLHCIKFRVDLDRCLCHSNIVTSMFAISSIYLFSDHPMYSNLGGSLHLQVVHRSAPMMALCCKRIRRTVGESGSKIEEPRFSEVLL